MKTKQIQLFSNKRKICLSSLACVGLLPVTGMLISVDHRGTQIWSDKIGQSFVYPRGDFRKSELRRSA